MTNKYNWRIDGRDIFIQNWKTDEEMTIKDAERCLNSHDELLEALKDAFKAIESLDINIFGSGFDASCGPWPVRDELLDKMAQAIAKAKEK